MHEIVYDPTRSDSYWIDVMFAASNGSRAIFWHNKHYDSTNCYINTHVLRNAGCADPATETVIYTDNFL